MADIDKYKETKERPCVVCGKMVTVTKFMSDKVVKCAECKGTKTTKPTTPAKEGKTGNTKILPCIKCGKEVEVTKFASAAKVLCEDCKNSGERIQVGTGEHKEIKFNIDMNKLDRTVVPTIDKYTVTPQLLSNKNLRAVKCPSCGHEHMKITRVLDWNPMGLVIQYQCPNCYMLMTVSEQVNKMVTMNNNGAFYDYSGQAIEDLSSKLQHTRMGMTIQKLIKIVKEHNIQIEGVEAPPYVFNEDRPVPVGYEIPKGDREIKVINELANILLDAPREGELIDQPEGARYIKISSTLADKLGKELKSFLEEE